MAVEECGNRVVTNMISLGVLCGFTKVVTLEALESAIKSTLRSDLAPMNLKALKLGYAAAEDSWRACRRSGGSRYGTSVLPRASRLCRRLGGDGRRFVLVCWCIGTSVPIHHKTDVGGAPALQPLRGQSPRRSYIPGAGLRNPPQQRRGKLMSEGLRPSDRSGGRAPGDLYIPRGRIANPPPTEKGQTDVGGAPALRPLRGRVPRRSYIPGAGFQIRPNREGAN